VKRFLYWLRNPEVIGPPGCPLMRRWTIFVSYEGQRDENVLFRAPSWFPFKLLIHHFLPDTEDVDPHDHPRPLWTLILKGGYLDLVPCMYCKGERYPVIDKGRTRCPVCKGRGLELGEEMTRGRFRHRPAEHRHVTKVSSAGAWTLCLMGPKQREWGFWRHGKLWQWFKYEQKFGLAFRCEGGQRFVEVRKPAGIGRSLLIVGADSEVYAGDPSVQRALEVLETRMRQAEFGVLDRVEFKPLLDAAYEMGLPAHSVAPHPNGESLILTLRDPVKETA
jgi:hypothetical protein